MKASIKTVRKQWYNRRGWAVSLGFVSLLVTAAIGLRALDTGSLQQYVLTVVLLAFGLNRLFRAVWPRKDSK
jgi:uncharacterized membrane protein HdeD (DUF308 family)